MSNVISNIQYVDDKWRGASVTEQSSNHVHIGTHHKSLDTDGGCQTSNCPGDGHTSVSITAITCVIVSTQRGDIALAITKCDMFDFLIDIVPREEILFKINRKQGANTGSNPKVVCVCVCVCARAHACVRVTYSYVGILLRNNTITTANTDEHVSVAVHGAVTHLPTNGRPAAN